MKKSLTIGKMNIERSCSRTSSKNMRRQKRILQEVLSFRILKM